MVVESLRYCKFILACNFCLIVDSRFHPSRALTRSLEAFTPLTWTYFCYLTAKLMADPRLLEMLRELKLLMDMCFHIPLNLAWFTCTPSKSLQMKTFSNIPMSSSYHLTLGMLLFWTVALHLPFLRKHEEVDDSLLRDSIFDELEIFTNKWYITWMFSGTQALQKHFMRAIQLWKTGHHLDLTLVGNLNKSSKIHAG